MNLLSRVLFIMLLGGWLVLPADVGLGVMFGRLFMINPPLALLLGLLLVIVINTLLPLRLRTYKRFTQYCLLAMAIIVHIQAGFWGVMSLQDFTVPMLTGALSAVFIFVAWPMIANRLWQWTHYQRAVDPSAADAAH